MPTYEYECTHCGYSFEAFQKMSDRRLEKCPKCDSQLKRLIGSGAGIIFRGSGFYATDYRKKEKKDTARTDTICPRAKEGCDACQHAK